jgi:hypothetical protein
LAVSRAIPTLGHLHASTHRVERACIRRCLNILGNIAPSNRHTHCCSQRNRLCAHYSSRALGTSVLAEPSSIRCPLTTPLHHQTPHDARRHGSQQPQGPSEQSHALRPQGGIPQGPEWYAWTQKASWHLLMRCSRDELHRDGGQGARGDQQRAVGYVIVHYTHWRRLTAIGASSTMLQEIANATFN